MLSRKKILLASAGMVLIGTTTVETMAGARGKEAVEVFAGERTVREASEFSMDRTGNDAETSNAGYDSRLIAIQVTPPAEDKDKAKDKTKPKPKPKEK